MRIIAPPHQFGKNQRSTSLPFGRRAKRRCRRHRAGSPFPQRQGRGYRSSGRFRRSV